MSVGYQSGRTFLLDPVMFIVLLQIVLEIQTEYNQTDVKQSRLLHQA